jgi:hypothetical protein
MTTIQFLNRRYAVKQPLSKPEVQRTIQHLVSKVREDAVLTDQIRQISRRLRYRKMYLRRKYPSFNFQPIVIPRFDKNDRVNPRLRKLINSDPESNLWTFQAVRLFITLDKRRRIKRRTINHLRKLLLEYKNL